MSDLSSMPALQLAGLSTELSALSVAIILGFVQLMLQGTTMTAERGSKWNMGARDGDAPPLGPLAGRFERAFRNFMETFPFFAAAILAVEITGRHSLATVLGAEIYLLGRIIYVPLYALGIPAIRTFVWIAATLGLLLVLAGLYSTTLL